MDSSEGRTYMTSICYPLQACVKIKRYSPEMVGKNGTIIIISAVCRSWTWHLSTFVSGWGYLISFPRFASMGLDNPFWPLLCSLPRHHDLWSVDVKYCQVHCRAINMFKRSWPLQISTFLCFSYDPDSQQKNHVPLSRVDDVGNIMAHLRSRSLPVDFSSLSRKLI